MLYSISEAMTELDIVLRFTVVITIGTIFVRIDTEIDTVFEVALNKINQIKSNPLKN
jgi:hypothetical protein